MRGSAGDVGAVPGDDMTFAREQRKLTESATNDAEPSVWDDGSTPRPQRACDVVRFARVAAARRRRRRVSSHALL